MLEGRKGGMMRRTTLMSSRRLVAAQLESHSELFCGFGGTKCYHHCQLMIQVAWNRWWWEQMSVSVLSSFCNANSWLLIYSFVLSGSKAARRLLDGQKRVMWVWEEMQRVLEFFRWCSHWWTEHWATCTNIQDLSILEALKVYRHMLCIKQGFKQTWQFHSVPSLQPHWITLFRSWWLI